MSPQPLEMHEVELMLDAARTHSLLDEEFVPASSGPAWQFHVAAGAPLPTRVSLRADQTPNKHQLLRGTCYAFATAAAMEAAIVRRYGRVVDLSEEYLFQVYKTSDATGPRTVSHDVLDTNSSLMGFQGNSNCVEAAARMAVPLEGAAPYLDQPALEWMREAIAAAVPAPGGDLTAFSDQRQLDAVEWSPGVVPLAARHQAEYRVTGFHQVGGDDLSVKTELANGREVVMDIPGHVLLVIGYDSSNSTWEVKNSHADTTPIWVPSGSWLATFHGGYAVDGVEQIPTYQPHAAWLGRWRLRFGPRNGELILYRFTDRNVGLGKPAALEGESTATLLGRAYIDGAPRDVNGWLTAGGEGMVMFVAPDSTKTTPGARVGDRFDLALSPDWMRAHGASPDGGMTLDLLRPEALTPSYASLTDASDLGLRHVGAQPSLVSWAPERLDIIVPASEGFEHSYYTTEGWSEWERLAGSAARSAGPGRAISATSWGVDRLDIFVPGEEGQLHHAWHDSPDGWGSWDDVGGNIEPGLAVGSVSRENGSIDVYAISTYGLVVCKSYSTAVGWADWLPIDTAPSRRLSHGVSVAADSTGTWLASVDAATRRPLLRRFDMHQGWGVWTELHVDAALSPPAVTTSETVFQMEGKPVSTTLHIFWLASDAAGSSEMRHTTGTTNHYTTAAYGLSGANPRGIAAASWGPARLDVVVTLETPDGDLQTIRSLDHFWSGDAGAGFGVETLSI